MLKRAILGLASGGIGLFLSHFVAVAPLQATVASPSLPLVWATSTSSARHWLDRGRDRYQAGRLNDAISAWEHAIRSADENGATLDSILSRSYLSLAYQDLGDWERASASLDVALTFVDGHRRDPQASTVYGQLYNTLGNLQLNLGQPENALDTWQQAETWYERADDELGKLGTRIDRAQALQMLGLYQRSQQLLDEAISHLQELPASEVTATGLLSLGNTLYVLGKRAEARQVLDESLAVAANLSSNYDRSPILLALGNLARLEGDLEAAFAFYQQAVTLAQTSLSRVEARTNAASIWLDFESSQRSSFALSSREADTLAWERLLADLRDLPPSRRAIYARIHLAQSWLAAEERLDFTRDRVEIAQLLAQSVRQARSLSDPRAEAYALGQLGQVYESNRQWEDARQLTQQAIALAQTIQATEIAARWQWQLGRILNQQGNQTAAIEVYDNALESLQALRQDLAAIAPEARFSFRDSVEPVYRQYIDLLLRPVSGEVPQPNLQKAREAIEALQLAEIDNFFREACLDAEPVPIDEIDTKAAAIYPIILDDRIGVILSQPGRDLFYAETLIEEASVNATLEGLVQYLNPVFPESRRMPLSQTLYDWLIRPLEAQLAESEPQTLVFVLDGLLRNLPMGVLHDGEQYAIEKYSIAIAPSLRLLQPENTAPTAEQPALMGGLSEARQGYVALPGVKEEVERISQVLSGEVLLNSQFTETQLQNRVNAEPFSVLHLATHGQFSSNAEETYLVTWDGRIEVKELDRLLRSRETGNRVPIDLLVLSACQTAVGDRSAALGLAGFAVRSGARSTLATLWSVGDRSTARLMTEFYAQLENNPRLSKSEALRQAQLKLLRSPDYNHPFYWSPFVLVGNWL